MEVTRPDIRKANEYLIRLDEAVLLGVEEGAVLRIGQLYRSLDAHQECDLALENGCKVREEWLLEHYGSLAEAEVRGYKPTDCSEDLVYLHTELARMAQLLFESRYLRRNPMETGLHVRRGAERALGEIKSEVAYREQVAADTTSEMTFVRDDIEVVKRTADKLAGKNGG